MAVTRMIDVVGGSKHGERLDLLQGTRSKEVMVDGRIETYEKVKTSGGKVFLVYRPNRD